MTAGLATADRQIPFATLAGTAQHNVTESVM